MGERADVSAIEVDTIHGVECYEAWREFASCPHEETDDGAGTPAPTWPDGTVRLPLAIESWLDGHFAGEKGDDADDLEQARNATAGALWSLIYRQGDPDTDQAALDAIRTVTENVGSEQPTPLQDNTLGPKEHRCESSVVTT